MTAISFKLGQVNLLRLVPIWTSSSPLAPLHTCKLGLLQTGTVPSSENAGKIILISYSSPSSSSHPLQQRPCNKSEEKDDMYYVAALQFRHARPHSDSVDTVAVPALEADPFIFRMSPNIELKMHK